MSNLLNYRQRAELIVEHNGMFLVTYNQKGDESWRGFPGGGIDPGETPEQAAVREALEEAGVTVTNVRHSGIIATKRGIRSKTESRSEFAGSQTHFVEATFSGINTTRFGSEGDAVKWDWMYPRDAMMALSFNPYYQLILSKYIK
jgi:8-oxo-dGTP pyrophosphatase MutT (NUDIX family)